MGESKRRRAWAAAGHELEPRPSYRGDTIDAVIDRAFASIRPGDQVETVQKGDCMSLLVNGRVTFMMGGIPDEADTDDVVEAAREALGEGDFTVSYGGQVVRREQLGSGRLPEGV